MKKVLAFVLTITLCLAGLWGCADGNKKGTFCRVVCLKEDGMIVEIPDLGHVYVKHVNADLQIGSLDTVVMEFAERDLKAETGKFVDVFGSEQTYSYILENPKSIRLADPSAGEPTFG